MGSVSSRVIFKTLKKQSFPQLFLTLASFSTAAAVHAPRCDPKCGQRGEQKSAVGLDVAGNEFGLSSVTCRGAGASDLTVTRHTSYAAGGGAGVDSASLGARCSPRNVGVADVSSGREHFRLRRRDKSSPRNVGVAGVSSGREHFRLRRRSFGCGAETQVSSTVVIPTQHAEPFEAITSKEVMSATNARTRRSPWSLEVRMSTRVTHAWRRNFQTRVTFQQLHNAQTKMVITRKVIDEQKGVRQCSECDGRGVKVEVIRMGPKIQQMQSLVTAAEDRAKVQDEVRT